MADEYQDIKYNVARAKILAKKAAQPVMREVLAQELPKATLPFDLLAEGVRWDGVEGGACLWLVPQKLFDQIPDGSVMVSINAEVKVKGVDEIDQDTRAGLLAFGFLEAQLP